MRKRLKDRLSFVGLYDLYDHVYSNINLISDLQDENEKYKQQNAALHAKVDNLEKVVRQIL